MKIGRTLFDWIREDFGYPIRLQRMLKDFSNISADFSEIKPNIDASSVPPWHRFGSEINGGARLDGWRYEKGYGWRGFNIECPALADIGRVEVTKKWTCDIKDIDGFGASKSNLPDFASTDAMVEQNSPSMIDEITHAKLQKNLSHTEIRIIHQKNTSDCFYRYLWDGRLWLSNSGGSHHTAAAKYIATRLNEPVPLCADLHTHSLNPHAVNALREKFEMFAIQNDGSHICCAFFDAMQAVKATWLSRDFSNSFSQACIVFLPRTRKRSMRVAHELRKAGILDFGLYLAQLLERQNQVLARLS